MNVPRVVGLFPIERVMKGDVLVDVDEYGSPTVEYAVLDFWPAKRQVGIYLHLKRRDGLETIDRFGDGSVLYLAR